MNDDEKKLLSKAKKILDKNWKGDHTVPSNTFYNHQWSWDSAFIAIGNSHINQERAQKELLAMFEGQWKNGMLPHIIFRIESDYFPGPDYWDIGISEDAPKVKTSGLVQPPVHAISALEVYRNAKNKVKARKFLKEIYPKILAFHRFLLKERDPEKSGLVTIFHPWESGFDNSTRWDEALKRVKPRNLPKYERTDTKKLHACVRPTKEFYDKAIYLIEIMKKYNYDQTKIYKKIPFKIKDVVFSSILYVANKKLLDIAKIIMEDPKEIKGWLRKTKKNYLDYTRYCDRDTCLVYDYDLIAKRRIEIRSVAALFGLYTDLLSCKHAERAIAFMEQSYFCKENCEHEHRVLSSIAVDESEYDPFNYWRGPIWINVNWMIYKGLESYGFKKEAAITRRAIIELVMDHGFYEYYNVSSGKGLGTNEFAWTASLVIDLLMQNERKRE